MRQGNVFYTCLSFCPRGGGGVSASVHAGTHPLWKQPPGSTTPSPGRHPLGRPLLATHPTHGQTPPGQISPLGQTFSWADTPPPADGYCSRRYASYWNAFLFLWAKASDFNRNLNWRHFFCRIHGNELNLCYWKRLNLWSLNNPSALNE